MTADYASASGPVQLARFGGRAVVIHTTVKDLSVSSAVDWLIEYLKGRGYNIRKGGSEKDCASFWTVDIPQSGANASFLSSARADAFVIEIVAGKPPRVVVSGKNTAGVRAGVARLISLLSDEDGILSAAQVVEKTDPFFAIRRLNVAPTGRIAKYWKENGLPERAGRWADTLWTAWDDERIKRYAEQIWLMGFNSVEVEEIRGYRGVYTDEQVARDITPKLRLFMNACRSRGMQVSQFIWGQSLFQEGRNYCWNDPAEKKAMVAEYARLAKTYGDLVDHVVVHVGDPGGCERNGCDAYKTTQEIAAAILAEYRKVNPDVTATLSTWANFGFWDSASSKGFLDGRFMPGEVGIALHRWYDPEKAELVARSGRPLDIWGWYLSDYEMELDMGLFMRRLDKYFKALPDRASKQVRAISTEVCFHGWPNIINAYVSGQLMLNPKKHLMDIEREWVRGVYGSRNAEDILNLYKVCEENVYQERFQYFIPASDCLPAVLGTPNYNKRLRKAILRASKIKLQRGSKPLSGYSADPADMLAFLLDTANVISIYSEAIEAINAAADAGADDPKLASIVSEAEKKAGRLKEHPTYPTLSGRLFDRLSEISELRKDKSNQ